MFGLICCNFATNSCLFLGDKTSGNPFSNLISILSNEDAGADNIVRVVLIDFILLIL